MRAVESDGQGMATGASRVKRLRSPVSLERRYSRSVTVSYGSVTVIRKHGVIPDFAVTFLGRDRKSDTNVIYYQMFGFLLFFSKSNLQ
jgi:hypothetical protein